MFDGLIAFGHSLGHFLTPTSVLLALLATLVGVIVGALPGLSATMGVALMTTLTIKLPSSMALPVRPRWCWSIHPGFHRCWSS